MVGWVGGFTPWGVVWEASTFHPRLEPGGVCLLVVVVFF